MNDSKKIEEPAFPIVTTDGVPSSVSVGITMRDYFAAKMMQAICGRSDLGLTSDSTVPAAEIIAAKAYVMADAMLKERARRKSARNA